MAIPLLGGITLAGAGAAISKGALALGVATGFVAGFFRILTLLGVGVAVYEGTSTLLPLADSVFQSMLAEADGSIAHNPHYAALGQVLVLLKVQAAFSLIVSAVITRMTFSFGLGLTRTATGGN